MRANEFVKEFGLVKSRDVVKNAPKDDCSYSIEIGIYLDRYAFSKYEVYIDDLKRLVESHNLVVRFGGLYMAKADVMDSDGWEKTSPYWMKIQQAIADVESCQ